MKSILELQMERLAKEAERKKARREKWVKRLESVGISLIAKAIAERVAKIFVKILLVLVGVIGLGYVAWRMIGAVANTEPAKPITVSWTTSLIIIAICVVVLAVVLYLVIQKRRVEKGSAPTPPPSPQTQTPTPAPPTAQTSARRSKTWAKKLAWAAAGVLGVVGLVWLMSLLNQPIPGIEAAVAKARVEPRVLDPAVDTTYEKLPITWDKPIVGVIQPNWCLDADGDTETFSKTTAWRGRDKLIIFTPKAGVEKAELKWLHIYPAPCWADVKSIEPPPPLEPIPFDASAYIALLPKEIEFE